MRLFPRLLPCILFLATPLWAFLEQKESRDLPTIPGQLVEIDARMGDIRIVQSTDDQAHLLIRREVNLTDPEEAEQYWSSLEVPIEARDDRLFIATTGSPIGNTFNVIRSIDLWIYLELSVPVGTNILIHNEHGTIDVGDLEGNLDLYTADGSLTMATIDGEVKAHAKLGSIILSRSLGNADLLTRRGSIQAGSIFGRAKLTATNGDIELLRAQQGVEAKCTAGYIYANFPLDIKAASELRTSGGNIVIGIDPRSSCRLQCRAVWGKITGKLPVTDAKGRPDELGKSRYTGQLNAGGSLIKLHASGGHIQLKPEPAPLED